MELFVLLLIVGLLAVPFISIAAFVRANRCQRRLDIQQLELNEMRRQLEAVKQPSGASTEPEKAPLISPPVPVPVQREPAVEPAQTTPMPTIEPTPLEPMIVPVMPAPAEAPTASQMPPEEPEVALDVKSPSVVPHQPSLQVSTQKPRFSGLEQALGLRWTVWVGGLILFVGAGLFVKYAFTQSWLGPIPRVVLGLLAGVAILIAGERFIRKEMRALGQGLVGVGLAVLYAALYGAYGFYHVLPQSATFGCMILITTVGMVLAVRHDALAVSFLATLGGFLTPLLLSSGENARDALFAYLLVLDIGVLGIACFKKWRALDILAFVGTHALFAGWYLEYGRAAELVLPTVLWLAAFFLVFLLIPFVYHLRTATCITGERFFLAVTNAVGMFGWTYVLLRPHYHHTLGLITLGMGVTYLALGLVTRKRIPEDHKAVFGFASLFLAFVIMAVPIHLDLQAVTIAWAVKAPVLLYLAYKYRYLPVRLGSLIPLGLALGRLYLFHWPLHAKTDTFNLVFNTHFGTYAVVLLAGFVYSLIHRHHRSLQTVLDERIGRIIGLTSGVLTLVLCHMELWQWLTYHQHEILRFWACSLVWIIGAYCFTGVGIACRSKVAFIAALPVVTPGLILIGGSFLEDPASAQVFVSGRFFAALCGAGMLLLHSTLSRNSKRILLPPTLHHLAEVTWLCGLSGLTLVASVDLWQWLGSVGQESMRLWACACVWVMGSSLCTVTALVRRSTATFIGGGVLLAIALLLNLSAYLHGPNPATFFIHGSYLTFLLISAKLLVDCWVCHCSMRMDRTHQKIFTETTCLGGLGLLVFVTSVETWQWVTAGSHSDARFWASALVCVLGAGLYAATARLRQSLLTFFAGLVFLGSAVLLIVSAYSSAPVPTWLLVNGRFLVGMGATAMIFAYSLGTHRWTLLDPPQRTHVTDLLLGSGIAIMGVLLSAETWQWFTNHNMHSLARSLLVLIATGSAGVLYGVSMRRTCWPLRQSAIVTLLVAIALSLWSYAYPDATGARIVLNTRFLTSLVPLGLAFLYALAMLRRVFLCSDQEHLLMPGFFITVAVILFALLNLETYQHLSLWGTDPLRARRLALMALSLVWGTYATALLIIGFRVRISTIRLTALALFGITAVKLVIVDMAKVQEVFRIVSFIGLGVLMIAASYLYHRAVKRHEL
ncbi:DUF2339 domain-containing protein [Planctomycetota bacterium]